MIQLKKLNACFLVFFVLPLLLTGCNPVLTITFPQDSDVFEFGEEITFTCNATDLIDGKLSGDSLVWTSSIDSENGTGLPLTSLPPGIHQRLPKNLFLQKVSMPC